MKLSKEQTKQLASAYAEYIIDGMDYDTMAQMCYDLLMDSYENMDPEDIQNEIVYLYDDEVLESLMETINN